MTKKVALSFGSVIFISYICIVTLKQKDMKTLNALKSLEVTLDQLYNGTKQIIIHLSDKSYTFHVVLADRSGKPDCKISSWGANLWARTPKGVRYEKYNSLSNLQSSLVRLVSNKVDANGDISFSITDDVHTM